MKDIGAVSPAFIPLHVLRSAGITHPYYTGFLGDIRDHFRVIDRSMLIDADGKPYPDWSRKKEIDPAIRDFRLLQYDMMFGDRDGTWEFFRRSRPPRAPNPKPYHFGAAQRANFGLKHTSNSLISSVVLDLKFLNADAKQMAGTSNPPH